MVFHGGYVLEVDKAAHEGAPVAPPQTTPQCAPAALACVAPLGPGAPCRPQQLLALVCKAVRASLGGVGVLGADGKLREHWTVGMHGDLEAKLRCSAGGAALVHFILEHAAPLRLANFDPIRQELALPAELGEIGPFLGIPLVYHGRPVGAFYLARPRGEAAFSPEDDQIVLPVREWLAQGDLFEEARLLSQLRLLTQVAQSAAGSRDLPTILHVALHELERHLPLYVTAVWLVQDKAKAEREPPSPLPVLVRGIPDSGSAPGTLRQSADKAPRDADAPAALLKLVAASSVPRDRAAGLGLESGMCVEVDRTPFASCLRDGEALYLDLARSDEPRSRMIEELAARGANSIFAVPLRTGLQTVGILQSICTRSAGFSNEQIQILYQVADLLGPAISNCQLFSRLRAAYEELRYTQNQLIKAEKMRALGELSSGMAHDFNNALCGALGFLELVLANKELDDVNRAHLQSARTCTLDAAETVRRVQDFARWQRKEFSVQLVDPNEVVRQTMELARHKWENLKHARG
ncbi:MAG TPA: GAF domain-containing protein, partial [Gemmataceae bacterium]|nr:GAF domain-containing protein [Gemmataceae bacterium]